MKKHFFIALALFMSVGIVDVSAQNFLNKLKKEVGNRVTNEVKKHVKKSNSQQQQNQSQPQPQSQSATG